MNLLRDILLKIEGRPAGSSAKELKMEGIERGTLHEHVILLYDEGFIEGILRKSKGSRLPMLPQTLTWKGREFVEAVRSDEVWEKTKEEVKAKGPESTASTLAEAAKLIGQRMLQG